jgi:hypothetical protein
LNDSSREKLGHMWSLGLGAEIVVLVLGRIRMHLAPEQ